jgi:hypothetical protein
MGTRFSSTGLGSRVGLYERPLVSLLAPAPRLHKVPVAVLCGFRLAARLGGERRGVILPHRPTKPSVRPGTLAARSGRCPSQIHKVAIIQLAPHALARHRFLVARYGLSP